MADANNRRWRALERWSPTLFLVGGGLVAGHATIRGLEAFTAVSPPPDVLGPVGYFLGMVGLLGLYPALVDRSPRVARSAAAVAIVPLVGWSWFSIAAFAELAGIVPPASAAIPGPVFLVHVVTFVLTYGLFAVASIRAGSSLRLVGVLLLAPPLLMSTMVVAAVVVGNSTTGAFLIGSLQAVVHLSVGGVLHARVAATRAPVGDPAVG